MVKVSVIIPVYNSEDYLRCCLESVLGQSIADIEVICINDGSTDQSASILNEYVQRDSRIKVLHQEKGGVTNARKNGLCVATGTYIGFVDSDDWIEPDMYENLYRNAIENQADFVSSGYIMEGAYTSVHYDCVPNGVYDRFNLLYLRNNTIYNTAERDIGLRGSLCCKLFKNEFIKNVQFAMPDTLTFSEDKMCVLSCVLEAEKVVVLRDAFYHYRLHAASTVHSARTDYLTCVNEVYLYLNMLYGHKNFTSQMRLQAELYVTELLIKGVNTRLGFQHRNLLWIDPSWLNNFPRNSRIVLYGGGEMGMKYRTHIANCKDLQYVGCVDFEHKKNVKQSQFEIFSPTMLVSWEYDYIVITIKNLSKAKQIELQLIEMGIPAEKIIWQEQPEIFWKYVEADGLIEV